MGGVYMEFEGCTTTHIVKKNNLKVKTREIFIPDSPSARYFQRIIPQDWTYIAPSVNWDKIEIAENKRNSNAA